ncbi:hypothetical protein [Cupriavidus necator]|uniref:hypothetical protein n=1 Tax=Cupriavidus necator TaxID=106590 RepID=UPI001E4FED82|nr:hypothetical protein [Cupriavidus necator]
MMDHLTKDGTSKLRRECSYPLTGLACVSRVYTELGTFAIGPHGVSVIEIVGDMSPQSLQSLTDVELEFTSMVIGQYA